MVPPIRLILIALLISAFFTVHPSFGEEDRPLYFSAKSMHAGLSKTTAQLDLHTPRSTLEHFLDQGDKTHFKSASHALNLNSFPSQQHQTLGPKLAEQLYYVVNQKLQIDWSEIPDRPDGTLDVPLDSTSPLAGKPRRSIKIGGIMLDGRDVEIRIDRYKFPQKEAIWLFSQRTVHKVPRLYEQYGPGPLMEYFPPELKHRLLSHDFQSQLLVIATITVMSLLVGWLLNWIMMILLNHSSHKLLASTVRRLRAPIALFLTFMTFDLITFYFLSLSGPLISKIGPFINTLIILSIAWVTIRFTELATEHSAEHFTDRIQEEEERHARQMTTHLSVARRVIIFIAIVLAAGFILRQFQMFETLSLSLLASAGVASVILGVAAHSVLGNLMAGVQVAISQPACIGDTVKFEDQYGYIEDITYTYISVRTWDLRRIVIPLSYFISHPFENWSLKNSQIIKPVYLYVDYQLDVALIRKKFEEILKTSPDWDQQVPPTLQVTSVSNKTMELRALCSAKDGKTAWSLHCWVREQLVTYIQQLQEGHYLPKQRVLIEDHK